MAQGSRPPRPERPPRGERPPRPDRPESPRSPGLPIISRDPDGLASARNFEELWEALSCKVPNGSPPTPDQLPADVTFQLQVHNSLDIDMPDGEDVRFWGFRDIDPVTNPDGRRTFPSPTLRVQEGQIMHCLMKPTMGTHTIHWHGMEPTAMNDGVGKLSFEVDSSYVYQWYASNAGTYFYHCHHNTVLHFEMGMYGMLLIDPPPDPLDPPGTRRAFRGGPAYDVEAIWVTDDVDPSWRNLNHDDGLKCPNGEDVGLNVFEPRYFMITGVPHPWTLNSPSDPQHPGVAVAVKAGQTLLVRLLCGAYSINECTIRGLDAEVVAMDGRAMGLPPYGKYSKPFKVFSGVPFRLTTARRYDLIIRPTLADVGSHRFTCEFRHYVNERTMGIAETFINVVP